MKQASVSNNAFVISADVLIAAFSSNNKNKKAATKILEKGIENNAFITEPDLIAFISHVIKKKSAIDLKHLIEDIQLVFRTLTPSNNAIVGATSLVKSKKLDYNTALLIEIMKENNISVIYSFNLKSINGLNVKRAYTRK